MARVQGKSKLVVLAGMALAGLGCGPGDDAPSQLEGSLNGAIEWGSGCNHHKPRIQRAMALAHAALRSDSFDACLQRAAFSLGDSEWAEYITRRLLEAKTTRIECGETPSESLGFAKLDTDDEALELSTRWLDENPSEREIAGVIVHEIAHNKGYDHGRAANNGPLRKYSDGLDYFISIPAQIEACAMSHIRNVEQGEPDAPAYPNGYGGPPLKWEAITGPAGGAGGRPFEIACPGDRVASGLLAGQGHRITDIGAVCMDPIAGGEGGPTLTAGSEKGDLYQIDCDGGYLVGVDGHTIDGAIAGLTPICVRIDDWREGRKSKVFEGTGVGFTESLPFSRRCPDGMVVRGLMGRAGDYLERLRLDCVVPEAARPKEEKRLAVTGEARGFRVVEKCPGRAAFTSLASQAGKRLDRLGGACMEVARDDETQSVSLIRAEVAPIRGFAVSSHGGKGGKVEQSGCSKDSAVIGLDLRVKGAEIVGLRGICSEVGRHADPQATSAPYPTAWQGAEGQVVTAMCPREYFLSGWELTTGDYVNSIQPICRRF